MMIHKAKLNEIREVIKLAKLCMPEFKFNIDHIFMRLELMMYYRYWLFNNIFVFLIKDKIAGSVLVTHNVLGHLFVGPRFRKNGIGSMLLEHAEEHIKSKGYKSVIVYCHKDNYSLMKKRGYMLPAVIPIKKRFE